MCRFSWRAILVGSSAEKLLGMDFSRDTVVHLGLSAALNRFVGVVAAAAVVGLIAGLFYRPLSMAAVGGVVMLVIGAAGFHRRACDSAAKAAPALLVVVRPCG